MNAPLRQIAEAIAARPLSPLHAMLETIERTGDGRRFNEIVNTPGIYEHVRGPIEEPLDLGPVIAHPDNICLLGEHGAMLFTEMGSGIFECHTAVLREGRGEWTRSFVRACLHHVFTKTTAVEVWTRCPHANPPTRKLAEEVGAVFEFTNPRGWWEGKDFAPADILCLTIQSWMRDAPGLPERGHWFHERLEAEYARHGRKEPNHPDDAAHDRYVGAAAEMIMGGQPDKGVIFYNRWAAMSGYAPIAVHSYRPVTIDIRDALIVVRPTDFWVATVRPGAH